ncbi:MAG: uncharacterized protein QOG16_1162 [Actinomycetota bacterium]|jgi:uncharacterized protein YggE|nr:uncharacterized protein [Actinomycetota bacterium]
MSKRSTATAAIIAMALLGGAALLAPTPGLTQTDTAVQDTVTVTAAGKVEGRPDLAVVNFGVRAKADDASEAMRELSARQNSVIDALRGTGLTEDQVTTGNISLGPACHYDRDLERSVCEGYNARTSVRAETTDIGSVGEVIDAGVAGGATVVNGVSFERTEDNEAIKEALAQAMDLAKTKAEVLATRSGRQLGRAIVIEEGGAQRPTFNTGDATFGKVLGSPAAASFVINPADQITKVRIVVTFALN